MRAEVIGGKLHGLAPSRDPFAQGTVDIFERLLGGRVSIFPDAIEDSPRDGLLLGLITQERVFERRLLVFRIDPHGFGELVASSFALAGLQQRVGEVFANRRALRREPDGDPELRDCAIVVLGAQLLIGFFARRVGRVGHLAKSG